MHSALRYIEGNDPFARQRIEQAIQKPMQLSLAHTEFESTESALPSAQRTAVELHFSLERQHAKVRGKEQTSKVIEACCLKNHDMQLLDPAGYRYRVTMG